MTAEKDAGTPPPKPRKNPRACPGCGKVSAGTHSCDYCTYWWDR